MTRTNKELSILAEKNPDIADVVNELLELRCAVDPKTIQCDFCYFPAVVEGWVRRGNLLTRVSMCRDHCGTLIGFEGKTDAEIDEYIASEYDPKSN